MCTPRGRLPLLKSIPSIRPSNNGTGVDGDAGVDADAHADQ